MNENIRPVFASDESIALGVVEPLDLPFVLGHRLLLSLVLRGMRRTRGVARRLIIMTAKRAERLAIISQGVPTKWDGAAVWEERPMESTIWRAGRKAATGGGERIGTG